MKAAKLLTIPIHIYVGVFLGLFLTHADMFLAKKGWLYIPPTWMFILLILPIIYMVIAQDLLLGEFKTLIIYKKNKLFILPFVFTIIIAVIWSIHPNANWQKDGKHIFIFVYALNLPNWIDKSRALF